MIGYLVCTKAPTEIQSKFGECIQTISYRPEPYQCITFLTNIQDARSFAGTLKNSVIFTVELTEVT